MRLYYLENTVSIQLRAERPFTEGPFRTLTKEEAWSLLETAGNQLRRGVGPLFERFDAITLGLKQLIWDQNRRTWRRFFQLARPRNYSDTVPGGQVGNFGPEVYAMRALAYIAFDKLRMLKADPAYSYLMGEQEYFFWKSCQWILTEDGALNRHHPGFPRLPSEGLKGLLH